MLNRLLTVDNIRLQSAGAAVSTFLPFDASSRKLPKEVVIRATGNGAYVRLSDDRSAATNADMLVQPGDHVVCSVAHRRWVSVLAVSGSTTVSVGALSTGVGRSVADTDPFTQDGPVLDLVFAGVANDPLEVASTTDDTLELNFVAQAYQSAAQYAVWGWGTGGLQQVDFADIVTFTRTGSTATYFNSAGTLTTAAADVPRFDYDPSTLAIRGLLIEEARTNNLRWSESFRTNTLSVTIIGGTFQNGETVTATGGGSGVYVSTESTTTSFVIYNGSGTFTGTLTGGTSGATATISSSESAWTLGANASIAIPPNTQSAPDGTTTAEVMQPTTVGTLARTMFQEFTTSTQGAWTFSIFVKAGTLSNNLVALRVRENTGTHAFRANFNLSTLATPSVSIDGGSWTAGVATVTPCQNGWVRLSVSGTVNTTVIFYRTEIWLGGYQNVADTIGTIYVWGGQLEAGAFPTSYIPTTTTALTRSADVASVNTLSPWFNATEGTLFAEGSVGYTVPGSAFPLLASLNDGTINNRIETGYLTSAVAGFEVAVGGVAQAGIYPSTVAVTRKVAGAYKANDFAACVNGGSVGTDTSGSIPVVDRLRIGERTSGNNINGHLRRITYYPRRLSNADLQTLTT